MPWLVMGPLWLREVEAGPNARRLDNRRCPRARRGSDRAAVAARTASRAATPRPRAWARRASSTTRRSGSRARRAREWSSPPRSQGSPGSRRAGARGGVSRRMPPRRASSVRQLGVALYDTWAIARARRARARARAVRTRRCELFERSRSASPGSASRTSTRRPAAELVDAYLRLGPPRGRGRTGAPGADGAREGTAVVAAPAPNDATRCSQRTTTSSGLFRRALALHVLTPDVFETACTHLAYGERLRRERQAHPRPSRSCARRSRSSTGSARSHGRDAHGRARRDGRDGAPPRRLDDSTT